MPHIALCPNNRVPCGCPTMKGWAKCRRTPIVLLLRNCLPLARCLSMNALFQCRGPGRSDWVLMGSTVTGRRFARLHPRVRSVRINRYCGLRPTFCNPEKVLLHQEFANKGLNPSSENSVWSWCVDIGPILSKVTHLNNDHAVWWKLVGLVLTWCFPPPIMWWNKTPQKQKSHEYNYDLHSSWSHSTSLVCAKVRMVVFLRDQINCYKNILNQEHTQMWTQHTALLKKEIFKPCKPFPFLGSPNTVISTWSKKKNKSRICIKYEC